MSSLPDCAVGSEGRLATAYAEHCRHYEHTAGQNTGGGGSGKYETPKALRQSIVERFDQFAGRQQHDAQELLACLLDSIHEDLNQAPGAKRGRDGTM